MSLLLFLYNYWTAACLASLSSSPVSESRRWILGKPSIVRQEKTDNDVDICLYCFDVYLRLRAVDDSHVIDSRVIARAKQFLRTERRRMQQFLSASRQQV